MTHQRLKRLFTMLAALVMTVSVATSASCIVVHGRRHGRRRRHIRRGRRRHHHRRRGHHSINRGRHQSRSLARVRSRRSGRFVEYGKATWYGGRFHGRKTASGERFDQNAMTAAHKTLPFGTLVRVTRLDAKRSVTVRINDRGPYGKGRIIDLSRAAASKLGSLKRGVVRVRLTVIRWGNGRYKRSHRKLRSRSSKRSVSIERSKAVDPYGPAMILSRNRTRPAILQGGFGRTSRRP